MKCIKFATGLLVGSLIGTAVGAILDPMNDRQSAKVRKKATNFFASMGTVIDGLVNR